MEVLNKSTIEKWIVPHLRVGKRGAQSRVALSDVVAAILHRLKTGVQWRFLPLKQFFEPDAITWNGVYYYFNKWFKDGSFQNAWIAILGANKTHLDLSSLQLDGSHTPAKQLPCTHIFFTIIFKVLILLYLMLYKAILRYFIYY